MIDVHCHLNFKAYQQDCDEVIQSAFAKGVTRIINVGTKIDSSTKAVQLAQNYDKLYAIVGVHPHHADKIELQKEANQAHTEDWIQALDNLAKHPKVLAIGEIGMDHFHYKSNGIVDPKIQREVFEQQIMLAHKHKLPLQIHNRHAGKDILEILNVHKNYLLKNPGMFHCFSGDIPFLKSVLNMGFFVGFDGNIGYDGLAPGETTALSELVKFAPLDRIVTETDSPYLTPPPHRGKRNLPEYVILIAQLIADIKKTPVKTVVAVTTQNVYTIFGKLQ